MDICYKNNIDCILTENLQKLLLTKKIAVIGCGGQGGYILEFLTRLGVNSIIFWDGDSYELSNINRQNGCSLITLGQKKTDVMELKLKEINDKIHIKNNNWFFGENDNDLTELLTVDFIFLSIDYKTLESINIREIIKEAIVNNIPVIDCPISSIGGRISINTKQDLYCYDAFTKDLINQIKENRNLNFPCSQTAFKCALIAAEAVNQMVQYFDNCRYANINSFLNIDIYHHKYIQNDKFGIF